MNARPEFRLFRDTLVTDWTMGVLSLDGKFLCYTLEDPVRELVTPNGWSWRSDLKVYGKTAIPSGIYPLVVTMSARFRRRMPLIAAVPDFTGIRLHSGTNTEHTLGCPLTGRERDQTAGRLWNSAGLTDALVDIIDEINRRHPAYIEIRNP